MVTYAKISPKSGEPQRYSWGTQKKKKKKKKKMKRAGPGGTHYISAVMYPVSLLFSAHVLFSVWRATNSVLDAFY